jgi:hypothetical protein
MLAQAWGKYGIGKQKLIVAEHPLTDEQVILKRLCSFDNMEGLC